MNGQTASLGTWFRSILPTLTFVWTWILTFLFFVRGVDITANQVTIFKIIYVTLALLFIISFQLSRKMWLRMIIPFWIFVLTYAIFVCLTNLLFKIQTVRDFFDMMGLNFKWQKDIGFLALEMGEIISFMLIEIAIIILVIVLQILLRKINPISTFRIQFLEKIVEVLDTFFDITKLTIFGIMMACISRVSVINLVLLIAAVISLVLRRVYRFIIIQLISLSSAIILLCQMAIQLEYFDGNSTVVCPFGNTTTVLAIDTWVGVGKMNPYESVLYNAIGYISIIAQVTIYTVVIKEENILEGLVQKSGWNPHKMFNDVIYQNSHKDFSSFMKYFLKYGFYRYGLELTYISIALLIQARLDFWALVYSMWLLLFVIFPPGIVASVWKFFKDFLVVVIPLQYAAALGVYPAKCFGFDIENDVVLKNTFQWMSLPMETWKPDRFNLFWDSVVFLFALCQANVFDFEKRVDRSALAKLSPSSSAILKSDAALPQKTSLGFLRHLFFNSLPTLTAISFFMAGTTSITIFSLFYGLGFALILWNTDSYFVLISKKTKIIWKFLLMLNMLIIFTKVALQIPGCIFIDKLVTKYCWVIQLFGISCFKTSSRSIVFLKVPIFSKGDIPENDCWITRTEVGIEWDIICFIMLILHRRFLQSEYYYLIAKQDEYNKKFSFRAAAILEELKRKDIKDMQEKYVKNLEKIQKNMKRLKEVQKRIRGVTINEPKTHQEAVTSGDYYMFQDSDRVIRMCSEFENVLEEQKEKRPPMTKDDDDDDEENLHSPNIGEVMETVMKKDIEEVLKLGDKLADSQDTRPHFSQTSAPGETHSCTSQDEPCDDNESNAEEKSESVKFTAKIKIKDNKLQPTFTFGHRKAAVDITKAPVITVAEPTTERPIKNESKKRSRFGLSLHVFSKFVRLLINSTLISLCQLCNAMSRDYKYIKRELQREKYSDTNLNKQVTRSPASSISSSYGMEKERISNFMLLCMCCLDLIVAHLNPLCYITIIILQIRNPTIYVIPLTMMVLCWGSLSVPRPTKRFWKLIILYTTVLLILECIIRSHVMENGYWIVTRHHQFFITNFITLDKSENYLEYYMYIILVVLWQRSKLKELGLWNSKEASIWTGSFSFTAMYLSVKSFFEKLLYNTGDRIPVDVYTHIFFCEFINIFVFIFGFASITEKKEDGVSRYFYENRIPPALLIIFIVQCFTIFLDRWIYLRRHVVAKLIFQFIQIVLVHINLFIVLPALTRMRFNHMFFPTLWYAIKSIYFLLSAYQIRCGYPASVHGHALCQSYNIVNLHLYQIYLTFPFVYELRTVTDWMWTESTLTLSEWLGMEDIFCTVFILKCWRNYDNKYSYRRGTKITNTIKFGQGGGIVLLFFLILLFPLAFFTFSHVAGQRNIPENMELSFRVGSLQPIFTAYTSDISSFSTTGWLQFQGLYKFSPPALVLLSEYYSEDVGVVRFSNYSIAPWVLSPIAKTTLQRMLLNDESVTMTSEWKIRRKTSGGTRQSTDEISGYHCVTLTETESKGLAAIMDLDSQNRSVVIGNVAPRFLKVGSSSVVSPIEELQLPLDGSSRSKITTFINVTFHVEETNERQWWQAFEMYTATQVAMHDILFSNKPQDAIIIYTFNDKVFPPGIISYLSAQGILGLYTTFLISLGFLIRRICRGRTNQIFLDYIPNVDCILQLLLDIYFVREHKDGKLEEDLYAKLIFLFRSPETLIQWTGKKVPE